MIIVGFGKSTKQGHVSLSTLKEPVFFLRIHICIYRSSEFANSLRSMIHEPRVMIKLPSHKMIQLYSNTCQTITLQSFTYNITGFMTDDRINCWKYACHISFHKNKSYMIAQRTRKAKMVNMEPMLEAIPEAPRYFVGQPSLLLSQAQL